MNSKLAAEKVLDLLEKLQHAIEEFAARSAKLETDSRARLVKDNRRYEQGVEQQNQQLAAATGEADAAFHTARTAVESAFLRRKARITAACQSSKESGLKKVEEKLGARKYELQKGMLHADRDRDAALVAAGKAIEAFREQLALEQDGLARLEWAVRGAFGGYRKLTRGFFAAYQNTLGELATDEQALLAELRSLAERAGKELARFRRHFVVGLLKYARYGFLLALALGVWPLALLLPRLGMHWLSLRAAETVTAASLAIFVLRVLLQRRAEPLAASISALLARARRLHDACQQAAEAHYQREIERIKAEFQAATRTADQQLKQALAEAGEGRVSCRMRVDERTVRVIAKCERQFGRRQEGLGQEHAEAVQRLQRATQVRVEALTGSWKELEGKLLAEQAAAQQLLAQEWRQRTGPLCAGLQAAQETADALFPPWSARDWTKWTPPAQFAHAAPFARLQVDLSKACEAMPAGKDLSLPGPVQFALPLCLAYPARGSILVETAETGQAQAIGALNNVILRLLAGAPAGRLNFTILDPVGLGQNFAGVMHLADYEEQIINSRIWTQSGQIEEKLRDLNEYMEKVIQMYLRNEYQTIAEYNEQAGVIAEKYHFLVVADFPANFTDTAVKRLLSIAASGARCGVYTLIHWDRRQPLPQDFIPDELRKSSVCVGGQGNTFILSGRALPGTELLLEAPLEPEAATEFIHQVGRCSRDSSRVEVPFEQVAPAAAEVWTADTTQELRVPIGRTGATKLQYMALGRGTCQHGLIAGKTGSGKSTLFHVIITNLALWCRPEQVEFYLVDFKKGVEFKCYGTHRLPHARVVAIESDREFGLSVLQRVDEELRRRGDLFRKLGVQDLPGYKRAGGTEPIPRTLLLVDEFQEFFVEDDKISQTASLLLDRIVRQGRAFGIHVVLGSQTLGGAYTVARTTLGQMVVRVALQCNEADAYLIMDDSNPAPRLLSRPGEGIYNDMAGALEGNSPFQVVWLPEAVRDSCLDQVRQRADSSGVSYPGPLVFEGNSPASVEENLPLRRLLQAEAVEPPAAGHMWLGSPNSIKGPTEAVFQRQSGNNLLLVGQRDEAVLSMFVIGLVALAAQYPSQTARFILCDASPPGTAERQYLADLLEAIPLRVKLVRPNELPACFNDLAAEKKSRAEAADTDAPPPVFVFIRDLQRFSQLRFQEDFGFSSSEAEREPGAGTILNDVLCEGTRLGFHVIASCDTYNNVSRFLSRKALSEFEMRVLFQMSANDSASLIDNPKAGLLGLHRALFYNAQEGYLETFRPYALPDRGWLEQVRTALARQAQTNAAKPEAPRANPIPG